MGGRLHEVVCKYRAQGVICLSLSDYYGKTANCEKCGWCPEVEARRKEAVRERLNAPEEERAYG